MYELRLDGKSVETSESPVSLYWKARRHVNGNPDARAEVETVKGSGSSYVHASFSDAHLKPWERVSSPPIEQFELPPAIEEELRKVFPHFQSGEEITPEAIRKIGSDWLDMVMNWAPVPNEIEFYDQDGNPRKITYEMGDPECGIGNGWGIPEDADWEVSEVLKV